MVDPIDVMFDVPAEQCSLLKNYLRAALRSIPDNSFLFDNDRTALINIGNNAVGLHQCSPSAQLLRAFYCLESVFMRVRHLDRYMQLNYVMDLPQTRTWKGLSNLLGHMEDCRKKAVVHQTALKLRGQANKLSWDVVAKDHMPRLLDAIDILLQIIEHTRPALAREEPNLSIVGTLLAKDTSNAGVTSLFVMHANNLINITEDNGIKPWDLTELRELFSTWKNQT